LSNIQDGYHSLDNKIQQLYYKQFIYKADENQMSTKAHVVLCIINWPSVATAAYPDIIFFQIFLYVKSIPIILFQVWQSLNYFLEMLNF
jgi:hypothetical protein